MPDKLKSLLATFALGVSLLPLPAMAQAVTPGKQQPDQPQTPDRGGTSIGNVPDALTVLEILRHLPRLSGGGSSTPDVDPTQPPPRPRNDEQPKTDAGGASPPRRVVTVVPGAPFVPRPAPRPAGTPPATTAAVVPETRDREVIVTLSAGSNANTVYELGQDIGLDGETLYASPLLNSRVVRFFVPDTRSVADVLAQLATDVRVADAQPTFVYTSSGAAQAAPLPVPQYAPDKLHLAEAHKRAKGQRVVVAVIDTAIDATHPALQGAIAETFDTLGGTKPVADAHGTAIAGIVGARSELTGVAPAAELIGIRAFEKDASGPARSDTMAVLKALDVAAEQGARVVNMSFAGPEDPLVGKAVAALIGRGIVAVAAAGNGGPQAKPAYPAAFPNVIAVTATDMQDEIYKDANRGSYIALAAPGVDIIAPAPSGAFDIASGTSMAAAHISGIAALLIERNPILKPADVRDALTKAARKSGASKDESGAGIADAAAAVARIK